MKVISGTARRRAFPSKRAGVRAQATRCMPIAIGFVLSVLVTHISYGTPPITVGSAAYAIVQVQVQVPPPPGSPPGSGLGARSGSGITERFYAQPARPGVSRMGWEQLPDFSFALSQESRRLAEAIRVESGWTALGRKLDLRVQALVNAADRFDQQLTSTFPSNRRNPPVGQWRNEFRRVQRVDAELEQELTRGSVNSPNTRWSDERVQRLIWEIGWILDAAEANGNPNAGNGSDAVIAKVTRRLQEVDARLSDIRALVRTEGYQDFRVNAINRDLDYFAGVIQEFEAALLRSSRLERLRDRFTTVSNFTPNVRATLERARPSERVRREWDEIEREVNRVTELLNGANPNPNPNPNPRPPRPRLPVYDAPLALTDQATAQLDQFLEALAPNIFVVPEGPQFQAEAQQLRDVLVQFRQILAARRPLPEAQAAFRDVDAVTQRVANRLNRIAKNSQGPNILRLRSVERIVGQIRVGLEQVADPNAIQ